MKSFEVGGHWPLWRGWKNRMTMQNRHKSNAKKTKNKQTYTGPWFQNTIRITFCRTKTFPERVIYQTAIVMYKLINKICQDLRITLHTNLKFVTEIQDLIAQFNYISQSNCEFFRKSIMYTGNVIWNSLPLNVNNASSVNSFK